MDYTHRPYYKPVLGKCVLGAQAGPQSIVVRQVVGESETQKSLDIHIRVPRRKPAIEQIIDVFVKRVCVTDVRVIPNKVIVRGHFEIKAIYVACLPSQPVHAVEVRRIRFTADIPMYGAVYGMDADAGVNVEYVDYSCGSRGRPHWDKAGKYYHDHDDDEYCDGPHHHHHDDCDDDCDHKHHHHDDCDDKCDHKHHHHDDCDDDCGHKHHHHDDCDDKCDHKHHHHGDCDDKCHHKHHHDDSCCFRHFDVSVVLAVTAKVMSDREVVIYPGQYPGHYPGLPSKPKG